MTEPGNDHSLPPSQVAYIEESGSPMSTGPLSGWTKGHLAAEGFIRETYRRGRGRGVIIIHEIPGIHPQLISFANDVVEAGFEVLMPSLLGTPGKEVSSSYVLSSVGKLCISQEFTVWALGRTSPIITYLRAMARYLHEQCGGPGIGVIGMCFSGGFALGMMVDGHVAAPVLSQPSLPFCMGKARCADLNLSIEDLAAVKEKVCQGGCKVLGFQFEGDSLVGTRFDTLRRELGDNFIGVKYPRTSGKEHSVLSADRVEEAVQKVLEFFRERLNK